MCYIAMHMRQLTILLFACAIAFAQAPRPDAKGCKDPAILSRLTGCWIARCSQNDYNVYKMPVGKPNKFEDVEGAFEEVRYACPQGVSSLQVFRNAENALKAKGYEVVYTDNYGNVRFTLTAKRGPQWVKVYSDGPSYVLSAVLKKQMEQAMQANTAEGWGQQISETGRASIYGINFDTGKATIKPDSEAVLNQVLALLQKQPDWHMVVAGHTDNVGTDAVNTPLSRQRAEAVIAWLSAKGINRAHLIATGLGSAKPLADNSTEEGRAKNRRVDLIKLY